MRSNNIPRTLMLIALLGGLAISAHAGIRGPYTVDANTLHLYHFDGTTSDTTAVASPLHLILSGNATVTSASYTSAFGTALATNFHGVNITDAGSNGGAMPRTTQDDIPFSNFCDSATGAFTMEALVKLDTPPDKFSSSFSPQIISQENETAGQPRNFQFRINKGPQLEFIQINPTTAQVNVPLPKTGNHSLVMGKWYHVAVTYNGAENTANNLKFYWTDLSISTSTANLIYSGTMAADIPPAGKSDFMIGNESRDPAQGAWPGAIDEVRISNIARTPDQMLFIPPAPKISAAPANVTFSSINVVTNPNAYTTSTVTITNTGDAPLTFQTQPGEAKKGIKVTPGVAGDSRVTVQSVTPDTANPLPVGQSVKVVLKFQPTATGFVEGGDNNRYYTLSIFTDDPDTPQLNMPLRGVAVPVELSTFKAE